MRSKAALRFFNLLLIFVLASCANKSVQRETAGISEVERAVEKAEIQISDSLEMKVKKALTLINQTRYYYPPGGTPENLPPPFDVRYHLDSLRTPEEILRQKIGGYCASAALVFAEIMRKSGVASDDIRVVAAVDAEDLEIICPKKGLPRIENPRTGASGHVFVALQFPEGWRLINTTDGSNFASVPWSNPEELAQQMKSKPVVVPSVAYRNFPPNLRAKPMVVFQSWRVDEVPLHTFDQRLDLIASGELAKAMDDPRKSRAKICRYGKAEMVPLKWQTKTN